MNKYLEKIALDEENKKGHPIAAGTLSLAGVHQIRKSTPEILGYHKLYHGTTKEKAREIRKKGFDPKLGGLGGGEAITDVQLDRSKGKVHFTKNYSTAKIYASQLEKRFLANEAVGKTKYHHNLAEFAKALTLPRGAILRTRVSHKDWQDHKVDKSMSRFGSTERRKGVASTYDRPVSPKNIGLKSLGQFTNSTNMKEYLSTADGMARYRKGAKRLGIGASLLAAGQYLRNSSKKDT